jgi:predicted  nucleic acid-binding Zn-ribbon protein
VVQLAEAVVSLTSELQNENKELVKKVEEHQECLKTVEALKKSLKDHGQDQENQLQALEKEIKSLKKHLTSVSKDFKVLKKVYGVELCHYRGFHSIRRWVPKA